MKFELFVAARYLRAKRREAVISVITVISVIGVAAGVASLIIALSINEGFQRDLQNQLLGSTSHINLLKVQADGIYTWRDLMGRLEKQPHVVAAAPALYEQVLVSRGSRAAGAQLKGVIPTYENRVSELLKSVKIGSAKPLDPVPPKKPCAQNDETCMQQRGSLPPIVPGKDLAETIGATVGSIVMVTSPQGELTPFGLVPKYERFQVVGIFNSGFYNYDSSGPSSAWRMPRRWPLWETLFRSWSSKLTTFIRRSRLERSCRRPLDRNIWLVIGWIKTALSSALSVWNGL